MTRWTLTHDELQASPTTGNVRPAWLNDLEPVAWSSVPILITDQNDSRRRNLAQSGHELSGIQRGPFVAWSCQIAEATSNTRLDMRRTIEHAPEGSLFLDAIDLMPREVQAEPHAFLTDGLQGGTGTDEGRGRSVRVIAGTSAPLLAQIKDGSFDEALFYRLNALHVVVDDAAKRCSHTGGHVT
jgi:DNA-binding NtrC family response regulator